MDAHAFLAALATVLCVAAVTTVLFQWLRQPVVLGYILAGLIVGPHVPIPLVADPAIVTTLSELGVILLMFSLGLEFSLGKLAKVGATASITAVLQCSVMIWLGYICGRAFGWTTIESLFTGGIIAISSTTIIAKAFDEQGIKGRLRELVVGVLIVEDLIAILLMTFLTAISSGQGLSAGELARSIARLAGFLGGVLVVGMLVVPRTIRAVIRLGRPETTLVVSIGICFAVAFLALELGYSVALGAFLAGSLIAESGEEKHIEHLVRPLRDMFGAIFFVSVGMLIDPSLIARHWVPVAVLTGVVILGMVISVAAGAFLTGNGIRTSVRAGMSLAQIGEFSFIIAGLGVALGATRSFLYPVAVAISALTTLTTPWLIRSSGSVASWVDRKLPRTLQTFAALYASWVERIGQGSRPRTTGAVIRRLVKLLLLDTIALLGIVIGAALLRDPLASFVGKTLGLTEAVADIVAVVAAFALAAPFCVGAVRVARRLGVTLAEAALPDLRGEGKLTAAAPQRALVVTLQLAIVLLVGLPLLAVTQPFLPGPAAAIVLLLALVLLGIGFWRGATNLQGHVRAGAQVIVEALANQARSGARASLGEVVPILPGLGEPEAFRLEKGNAAVGKTLAQLDLRGLTGATVLVITRADGAGLVPTAHEVLKAGDILALAGSHEALEAAKSLLAGG